MALPPRQLNLFGDVSRSGFSAGTDEAGRGALAGPVVAAAVILPEHWHLPYLNDSKKLAPSRRETLAAAIKVQAVAYGFGVIWPRIIDRINILQASLLAMARAVRVLRLPVSHLFIDGTQKIPTHYLPREDENFIFPEQEPVVRGDALIPAISAASILAKTFRDKIMARLDKTWPEYGFYRHKGYGAKTHLEALQRYGPSPVHRLTFRGVLSAEDAQGFLPCGKTSCQN